MNSHPHSPVDAKGQNLQAGDLVRVLAIPDLTGMSPECVSESKPVFEHIVGKRKRIEEFDESGCVWIRFAIRSGKFRGTHSVAVEPHLLAKVRPRVRA